MVIGYSSKHLMGDGLPPKILVADDDCSVKQWYVPERTCHIHEYEYTCIPICSECGAPQPEDYEVYFCWSCGAKVIGPTENDVDADVDE